MIVAVAGGKGGVGTSTLALSLARELEAVAVDADLAVPDLPRGTGPDLHAVLAGRVDPTAAVDEGGPMPMLSCGRTLAGARAADVTALPAVLDRLERAYGRVVVDCPAGLARHVGTVLESVDRAVLVTTPAAAALVDALRVRTAARALETPIAAAVLNRVSADTDDAILTRLDREIGAPVTQVTDRPTVGRTLEAGRPLRDVAPESPALEAVAGLAGSLLARR